MATHDDTQQDENTALSSALSAAYDAVEAGDPAPNDEALEIDAAADAHAADAATHADTGEPATTAQADTADDGADAKPEGEANAKSDAAAQPADGAEAAADPEDAAPSSWKREIAEKWKDVPVEVRAEIQRREDDYHKGIEQYKSFAQVGHAFERAITPNMDLIQAGGVNPIQAIEYLFNAHRTLTYGNPQEKAAAIGRIARDCGIDLATVQPPPPVDPAVRQLQQQNQQLQQFQRSVMDQQNQTAQSEIEQFRANPANVHFEVVKDDMSLLLQSGRATSLQDAYDKTVWMRPDIRKSLVEQQRTDAQKTATAQARDKRAKAAAVGVKGSALSKGSTNNPDASLRETIAAAMAGDA